MFVKNVVRLNLGVIKQKINRGRYKPIKYIKNMTCLNAYKLKNGFM